MSDIEETPAEPDMWGIIRMGVPGVVTFDTVEETAEAWKGMSDREELSLRVVRGPRLQLPTTAEEQRFLALIR